MYSRKVLVCFTEVHPNFFFQRVIRDHEENFDPDNIRDYIDRYLVEMMTEKNADDSYFTSIKELIFTVNI